MIEEVVNSILEAEDIAAQKIVRAKAEANELYAHAEAEADSIKKRSAQKNKELFSAESRRIEQEAAQVAQKELAARNAEADKELASHVKNVPEAVKIILEQFK